MLRRRPARAQAIRRIPGGRLAVLIDTDLLVDRERGVGSPEVELLIGDEERPISAITVSELLHGVQRARRRRVKRQAFVEHLLASLEAIPITKPVARVHAEVRTRLADRGEVIGAHDLWTAATALAHGLGVATGNAPDFERVRRLRVVATPQTPWGPDRIRPDNRGPGRP